MKKSKKILSLLLAATMVTSLAACGKKAEESKKEAEQTKASSTAEVKEGTSATETKDVKLVVWSPQEDQAAESGNWLSKMCDAFNAEHPEWNITFEYGVCSEGDAKGKVGQDPTAAADIYMYANDQVGDLVAANAITEFGGKVLEDIKANNSQTMVDTVTYKDAVYGIPFTSNTWFMYYDKRVFTEDDVKSLEKMLEKGKVSFPLSNSWYTASFYVANGGTLFGGNNDEAAGIDFGGDKGVAVTKYLVDLVANPNFSNDADGSGIAGLADGSVNAVFSGTWDYNNVVEKLGVENIGTAQLPTIMIDGKEAQLRSFAGSKAIAVNPNTKDPEVAVALAAYLGGTMAQKEHYNLRKVIPTDVNLLSDPTISGDALATAQGNTVANTSIMQPFTQGMSNYWDNTVNMANAIINKEVTHDNAAEKTEAYNNSLNGK